LALLAADFVGGGTSGDSLEDPLEAARAAQSYPAVIVVLVAAILLNWLVNRLLREPETLTAPAAAPKREPARDECDATADALLDV
jgi:hypothetical protein